MNVTVENLAPCKKLVRVEVEAQKVDETFETVTKDFQKQVRLPGFRPGKAPREILLRKFEKEIQDETKRKLMNEAYKKAIEEQKLEVITAPDVEEIQFGRGQPLLFAATVETAPEFEVPEYKGLPVMVESRAVSDADVERALETLRQPRATFKTVDRPVQRGDMVVVNYSGTCEGKPITEIAPTAQGLTEKKGFWLEVGGDSFIPGFAEQLVGAKAKDKRTVTVNFPADFVTPQLAGKQGVYDVEVMEVKEKVLPELDDTLAKAYGAENLEKLREGVRRDLQNELEYKKSRNTHSQILRALMGRVNFELPESAVARETRNVVYDIVQQNQQRGISRELIEEKKEQIYSAAASNAKERVKISFLLQKIAEKEDIKVSHEEITRRIVQIAKSNQIPPEKFAKDLQERNGLIQIYDQIQSEKVMDFLQKNAKFEELPPGQTITPG